MHCKTGWLDSQPVLKLDLQNKFLTHIIIFAPLKQCVKDIAPIPVIGVIPCILVFI